MTGLVNRRDMMERIEREASRANRHQRIFCALLLNIDNFRHINDVHGYNIGDDVLVELARVLRGGVRSEDVCARWGGDEFLILLPETRREGAEAVARKVLESITMTEFKAQKPGIWVTVSIGVRGYDPSQNIHECVFSADKALQQAKRDGKNRYVIAE
ncbi:GGDEF domain-containing protein [Pelotalea chapellei]